MTTYRVERPVLVVTLDRSSTFTERRVVYQGLRADSRVPDRALLLIDARDFEETFTEAALRIRVTAFFEELGSKLGSACAFLVSTTHNPLDGYMFQIIAEEHEVRVGLFHDDGEARRWLHSNGQDVT